jgi:hypothetical protein
MGVVVEKCINGLYLLYTLQNLLGTIFRITFTVFYRRIWSIVGKYSILCCDRKPMALSLSSVLGSTISCVVESHTSPGPLSLKAYEWTKLTNVGVGTRI